ncbi:putative signal transduction protein with Nacht domain [Rippkaea orientalis PCC 8801]|uniref:Putative signal transduction protein with Nacht domain n=1 Tax=Rippkaea orientalis (strain PCC 8801 / RF-1) TaxID=41431 RepID=B7K5H1_RIPO1|nr:TIR domain-containing protein [Rippkaea orientalis]ACK66704.1 putative signal transduction protein with Nacht domain [Rippkaea orientalis PCC 8801]
MTFDAIVKSNLPKSRPDYDVFISYSRRDKEFVRLLWEKLLEANYTVWVDWQDIPPAEDWRQEIYQGIEASHNFLFIISSHSLTSVFCQEELTYAINHNKRLIAIIIQEPQNEDINPDLAKINWIFCSGCNGQECDNFKQSFQQLLQALETDFNYVKYHTRLLMRAKEWENKQYNSDFLLLGTNLEEAEKWLAESQDKQPEATALQQKYIQTSRIIETEREAVELRLRRMTPQELRNRQTVLNKVNNYWIKGVLENSIHEQALIMLELEEHSDAVASPWNLTLQTSEKKPKQLSLDTSIISIFDQMGEGRTLLILGEPGSGKTTTLLQLTRHLINRANEGIDDRIPVVLNLSNWSVEKRNFTDWLVEELNSKYQVPKKVGKTWVQQQQLLLLLDGLDEVTVKHREKCLQTINQFHQNYSPEIVVCSRFKEYKELSSRLNFQKAIYLKPLQLTQVLDYLKSDQIKQSNLVTLIERDKTLQELVTSPLMLNLMILAYQDLSFQALPQTNIIEERRQQLFDRYIEQMFKRREIQPKYSKEQVIHWLNWLARRMTNFSTTVFLIEEMQPNWLLTNRQKYLYRLVIKILSVGIWASFHVGLLTGHQGYQITLNIDQAFRGMTYGLMGAFLYALLTIMIDESINPVIGRLFNSLILGIIYGLIFSVIYGNWIYGIAYGIIYGLIGLLIYRPIYSEKIEAVEGLKWSWVKAKNNLIFGLIIGICLRFGTSNELLPSLIFGLIISLIFGFDKDDEVDQKNMPNQGIWRSCHNSAKLFATIAILTGLFLGVLQIHSKMNDPAFIIDLDFVVVNAFIFGLAAALIGGQWSGITCIKHFTLRLVLGVNGYSPWNYAKFLSYTVEHIFLQKVGNGYVFVHRLLLDYFAKRYDQ